MIHNYMMATFCGPFVQFHSHQKHFKYILMWPSFFFISVYMLHVRWNFMCVIRLLKLEVWTIKNMEFFPHTMTKRNYKCFKLNYCMYDRKKVCRRKKKIKNIYCTCNTLYTLHLGQIIVEIEHEERNKNYENEMERKNILSLVIQQQSCSWGPFFVHVTECVWLIQLLEKKKRVREACYSCCFGRFVYFWNTVPSSLWWGAFCIDIVIKFLLASTDWRTQIILFWMMLHGKNCVIMKYEHIRHRRLSVGIRCCERIERIRGLTCARLTIPHIQNSTNSKFYFW